ncbi:MAG: FitA-like ribbon-helix-helix domain-containing protein [Spirochaetota bacterium]
MKAITIRGIDDELRDALKKEARRTGKSMNRIILEVLKEMLGLKRNKKNVVYHDLDALAGGWSRSDEEEFAEKTKYFEIIDERIWG